MNATQPEPQDGPRSRTWWARRLFLDRRRKLVDVLHSLESEVLAGGWRAVPVAMSYEGARERYKGTSIGGRGRAFVNADDYADKMLNHCGRIYSLEATHQATIAAMTNALTEHAGRPALEGLRAAVRASSLTATSEMVRSQAWIASVTDRVTLSSRQPPPQVRRSHLWSLRNAPPYTFAGIYTALLGALGYTVTPRVMTRLAFEISAVVEGLALSELSRGRTPGARPALVAMPKGVAGRRATDPHPEPWPLLGFLVMKLLEPVLARDLPARTVGLDAGQTFLDLLRQHDAFQHSPGDSHDGLAISKPAGT